MKLLKAVKRLFIAVIVLVLLAGVGALAGLRWLNQPYKGYTAPEVFVEIPNGTGVNAIGHRLVDAGVIRNTWSYQLAMRVADDNRPLKAGEYRFTEAMTPADVIEKLARGDVYLRPITFPEGLTIAEMGGIFEQHGFGSAKDFIAAATSAETVAEIRALDPAARTLEGYVFPETYALPRHTTAPMLVNQMVERFKRVTAELRAETQARAGAGARADAGAGPGTGAGAGGGRMNLRELVTLASLVEKETAKAEERPLVAAVYRNRLRIGMPLQCDPTVIYALRQAGVYNGNLTRTNLQFDSRYNTYRYPGLPPGPIASPGRASLEAAAHPADVPYLYFVSKNDGSHVFATTLAEHNRNVQQYQVLYFRNNRQSSAHRRAMNAQPTTTAQPSAVSRGGLRNRTARSVAPGAAPASRG